MISLEALYRKFGRMLVSYWITIGLFLVIAISGVMIVNQLVLAPMIARLPYSASSEAIIGTMQPWLIGFTVFCVVMAAFLIRFNLIEPLLRRRRALEADLAQATPREMVQALSEQREKLNEQLDAALEDNLDLRDVREQLQSELGRASRRLRSVIEAAGEPVMLLDADGSSVIAASHGMLSLLNVRATDLPSIAVADLIRAFDALKDRPREYQLPNLIDDAISQASAIPKLQDVVLLDLSDREHRVMLASQSILAEDGQLLGLLLRIDDMADQDSRRLSQAEGSHHQDDRVGLERRLEELLNSARRQGTVHCLASLNLDNAVEIYERFGLGALEELFWLLLQQVRDEFGASVELFTVSSVIVAVVLPGQSPEDAEAAFDRLREQIEGREFHWKKQSYRATVSIALSVIDEDVQSVRLLIEEADAGLRQARAMGGNRVALLQADEVGKQTRAIDQQLVNWLQVNTPETRLHMQSLVLSTPLEADDKPMILTQIRVEMEDGFWADPGAFLASAARVSLLQDIDLWLLRRSLDAANQHPELALSHGAILVPVHIQSVTSEGFLQDVQDLVLDAAVDPGRICLALSEQDCSSQASKVKAFTDACRESGMDFAITGCRIGAMSAAVSTLQPALIGLHPSLYAEDTLEQASQQAALAYMVAAAHAQGAKLAVMEPMQEAVSGRLRSIGIDYVGQPAQGLGPLY